MSEPDFGVDHAAAAGGGAAVRRGVDADGPALEEDPAAAAGGGDALRRGVVGPGESSSSPTTTGGAAAVRGRLARGEGTGACSGACVTSLPDMSWPMPPRRISANAEARPSAYAPYTSAPTSTSKTRAQTMSMTVLHAAPPETQRRASLKRFAGAENQSRRKSPREQR